MERAFLTTPVMVARTGETSGSQKRFKKPKHLFLVSLCRPRRRLVNIGKVEPSPLVTLKRYRKHFGCHHRRKTFVLNANMTVKPRECAPSGFRLREVNCKLPQRFSNSEVHPRTYPMRDNPIRPRVIIIQRERENLKLDAGSQN